MSTGNVIAAFPGTGKTFAACDLRSTVDLDSSHFAKLSRWPNNYCEDIALYTQRGFNVLVSTHPEVRAELRRVGIEVVVVYPAKELRDEYVARYTDRNSSKIFIELMLNNWDSFIGDCEAWDGKKIVLQRNQFLTDVLDKDCAQLGVKNYEEVRTNT